MVPLLPIKRTPSEFDDHKVPQFLRHYENLANYYVLTKQRKIKRSLFRCSLLIKGTEEFSIEY